MTHPITDIMTDYDLGQFCTKTINYSRETAKDYHDALRAIRYLIQDAEKIIAYTENDNRIVLYDSTIHTVDILNHICFNQAFINPWILSGFYLYASLECGTYIWHCESRKIVQTYKQDELQSGLIR